jgi:elongation factor P hydroxylase
MANSATASARAAERVPHSPPDCDALCALFDELFLASENTRLVKGGDEPVYLPADAQCPEHRIVFRLDYAPSALHEIAHWCIAGTERRLLLDYGYWYSPDGRDATTQREFERLEARPQALEWLLNEACGMRFRPSIDNLDGAPGDLRSFAAAIAREAAAYCVNGLPPRAARLHAALAARFGGRAPLRPGDYDARRLLDGGA